MLSRLVASDPDALAKIREVNPAIPSGLLTNLLRVGERSLHADLLLNNCLAYRKLRLMPYSTQEAVLRTRTVDLVIDLEKGEVLRVPITELNAHQTAQVISREGIRSRDDQRAYIRLRAPSPKVNQSDSAAWYVKKDKLIIVRGCELSKAQLLACLGEMVA